MRWGDKKAKERERIMYRIGFDIGGTNIAAGIVDESLAVTERITRRFEKQSYPGALAETVAEMTRMLCQQAELSQPPAAIGVAVPGSIDPAAECVLNAYNLGLHDVPLRAEVGAHFPQIPVFLANDADAAALAELYGGAFRDAKCAVLFTLGTGVGGGVIVGGKLWRGGMGHGVELGHMALDIGGAWCTCGMRGCIETRCAATALIHAAREALAEGERGLLFEKTGGDAAKVDAKLVVDCARAGDAGASAIFARFVDALGSAVVSVIHLLDPEVVAIGGGVSLAGEFLFAPLRENVREKCFFSEFARIVPARFGNDAGIVGAAMLERDAKIN
jgi:glucokinase